MVGRGKKRREHMCAVDFPWRRRLSDFPFSQQFFMLRAGLCGTQLRGAREPPRRGVRDGEDPPGQHQGGVHRLELKSLRAAPRPRAWRCSVTVVLKRWIRNRLQRRGTARTQLLLHGATRQISQREEAESSGGSPGRTAPRKTMKGMFAKCVSFLF